jgi:hypothetical protein
MIKAILYSSFFLLNLGCTQFVKQTDDKYFEVLSANKDQQQLNIIFSHNINGETHPCGCRNFPLGGIPQVAGALARQTKTGPVLYLDTGDTFFPGPVIPDQIKNSSLFTAEKIAESFDMLGLKYFVPGDQDFALGEQFLIDIANKHKFKFLMTNASSQNQIKHSKWASLKFANQKIILLGILHPDLLNFGHSHLFTDPIRAIEETYLQLEKDLGTLSDTTIIVLSHSGLDFDQVLAQKLPNIHFIIGAHSQSFLRTTSDVGKTRITQVLSRNHYLGHISLAPSKNSESIYNIIEVRDELKDEIISNPFNAWLDQYKTKLEEIQRDEQIKIAPTDQIHLANTAQSCLKCHEAQANFWQSTSHALAYTTLEKNQAQHNPNCIGCHSLNYKSIHGFSNTQEVVKIEQKKQESYWQEWSQIFKQAKTPRHQSAKERKDFSHKWMKLDQKHNVSHNFANVQCLNCHDKSHDHPFEFGETKTTKIMSDKCIQCHSADQSPEWYDKNDKGLATGLNKKYFAEQLKKVACPKINE